MNFDIFDIIKLLIVLDIIKTLVLYELIKLIKQIAAYLAD